MLTLRQHFAYARYVLRHKRFVLRGCRMVGASLWDGLVHDASKFLPSEWVPYAACFYAPDGSKRYQPTDAFERAWNAHQKRNRHHWQYWVLFNDAGTVAVLRMPERYVREMVADWIGAGLAITGKLNVAQWYAENAAKMMLHADTRELVASLIAKVG